MTRGIEGSAKAPDYRGRVNGRALGDRTIRRRAGGGEPLSLGEGDRVSLVRPCWGMPEPDTGVLVQTGTLGMRDAATYRAGSNGTIFIRIPRLKIFVEETRAKSNYIASMDDGRRLYSGNPSPRHG